MGQVSTQEDTEQKICENLTPDVVDLAKKILADPIGPKILEPYKKRLQRADQLRTATVRRQLQEWRAQMKREGKLSGPKYEKVKRQNLFRQYDIALGCRDKTKSK